MVNVLVLIYMWCLQYIYVLIHRLCWEPYTWTLGKEEGRWHHLPSVQSLPTAKVCRRLGPRQSFFFGGPALPTAQLSAKCYLCRRPSPRQRLFSDGRALPRAGSRQRHLRREPDVWPSAKLSALGKGLVSSSDWHVVMSYYINTIQVKACPKPKQSMHILENGGKCNIGGSRKIC